MGMKKEMWPVMLTPFTEQGEVVKSSYDEVSITLVWDVELVGRQDEFLVIICEFAENT